MAPSDRLTRQRVPSVRRTGGRAHVPPPPLAAPRAEGTGLRGLLRTIDGGPFQSYRRILGEHELGDFSLAVQSVPPDALGGPARLRLSIDRKRAGLVGTWSQGEHARLVLEDAIVRAAARAIEELSGPSRTSAPGSGRVWIEPPGPQLSLRTTASVGDERVELSLAFDLPGEDRRVRGRQAESILFDHIPRVGMAALLFPLRRVDQLKPLVAAAARRSAAAGALAGRGFAALVPSSSMPDRNLTEATTLETPHGLVSGLAIPTGITLFVTSGVAGAGAWLRERIEGASSSGEATAILGSRVATLRASRRAFGPLDVRAFVRACPEVPDPEAYETDDAPAPLALAASLIEAVEAGARILVIDEDEMPGGGFSSDGRMASLVGEASPVFPFGERLAQLRDRWGLSFLIAARAAGSLCDVADTVFVLRDDRIEDATQASRASRRSSFTRTKAGALPLEAGPPARSMRIPTEGAPQKLKVSAWGLRGVRVGEDLIDLRDTTLSGDAARLRAVAALLKRAAAYAPTWRPFGDVLDALCAATTRPVLDQLEEPGLVDLARPTRIEIAGALVRWKRVCFRAAAGKLPAVVEGRS